MSATGFGWRGVRAWPWVLLALAVVPAVWHVLDFPEDVDPEFPQVVRPTFSRRPPPAYRLAEPGDTIDRVALYAGAVAVGLAAVGWFRSRIAGESAALWPSALGLALAATWYSVTPWPTFDGWHGLGWQSLLNPQAPPGWRIALALVALGLAGLVLGPILSTRGRWRELVQRGRARGLIGLLAAAVLLVVLRGIEVPGVEPVGYWPRFAFVWGLMAFDLALIRATDPPVSRRRAVVLVLGVAGIGYTVVAGGLWVVWYHRPLARLKVVEPGRIYMSAMPTYRGLEVAHARHRFKTIINLFPEVPPLRSRFAPEEQRFVSDHGIRYLESPGDVASSDAFLDQTLALAQDPAAWPILVHCHGCMDRTPAWVGIYRFLVQGQPLDEIFREIERHRGYRPKGSVTLLYNRVLPPRAPARYTADPTAALLRRCAAGTCDPYYDQVQAEAARPNSPPAARVSRRDDASRRP